MTGFQLPMIPIGSSSYFIKWMVKDGEISYLPKYVINDQSSQDWRSMRHKFSGSLFIQGNATALNITDTESNTMKLSHGRRIAISGES
jgi:hypothetical protein